jgi:hypothetical protein
VPGPPTPEDFPGPDDAALAERLWAEWDQGRGTSKSQIEIREWDDPTAHGRRFDRFIRRTLGQSTNRPPRHAGRVAELERQVRRLGAVPTGPAVLEWEPALYHARTACLAGLRLWNDPTATFRTGGFALHIVAAWNSLSMAVLHKRGGEWPKLDDQRPTGARDGAGHPRATMEAGQPRATMEMVHEVFAGPQYAGLRENVCDWVNLANSVAHRHLPPLDVAVVPLVQAALLNFENALAREFGEDWALAEQLSVPLELSGFRYPAAPASLTHLRASLPPDVQAVLARAGEARPELLSDPTYQLRVAFVPTAPAPGHSPDAIAYFVRPGEVPAELAEAVTRLVVLARGARAVRPNLGAKEVVAAVSRRIPWRFGVRQLAPLARALGARPPAGAEDKTATDARYCEYVPAAKLYLYSQAWVDRLVDLLTDPASYEAHLGQGPVRQTADDGEAPGPLVTPPGPLVTP